jgi:hypothetical protein
MIFAGMGEEGVRCFENVRRRFDGERRNPWDEPECGHHYARAMSAWSGVLAISGFAYHGGDRTITARPRSNVQQFRSFWSAATAWGWFAYSGAGGSTFELGVAEGSLPVRSIGLRKSASKQIIARVGDTELPAKTSIGKDGLKVEFPEEVMIREQTKLVLTAQSR